MSAPSPHFNSQIEALPSELLIAICSWLDTPVLARLQQVSRAWNSIVRCDAVLKPLCVEKGLLDSLQETLDDLRKPNRPSTSSDLQSDGDLYSYLRRQGWTDNEFTSYWSLLLGYEQRSRGLPFRERQACHPQGDWSASSVPSLHKRFIFPMLEDPEDEGQVASESIRRIKIDQIDRCLITTGHGGLKTTCIDTGELLWCDESVRAYAHLEYDQGWATTCSNAAVPSSFDIWRFDRLSITDGTSRRGVLNKFSALQCCRQPRAYRMQFPHLAVLTTDLHLMTYDIRDGQLLHDIDVTPPPRQSEQREGDQEAFVAYVEFDDEYYFVLLMVSVVRRRVSDIEGLLQVFSRVTGRRVWQTVPTEVSDDPRTNVYKLDPGSDCSRPGRWKQPSIYGTGHLLPSHSYMEAVHHDQKTGSLVLHWNSNVIIVPRYKKVFELQKQQPSIYSPIILAFDTTTDPDSGNFTLTVGNGLACMDLERGIMLIDLAGLVAGDIEASLSGFLPSDVWDRYEERVACTAIQLDQTSLVFQGVEVRVKPDAPFISYIQKTTIVLFDFAEMGRLRDLKGYDDKEKQKVLRVLTAGEEEGGQGAEGEEDEESEEEEESEGDED